MELESGRGSCWVTQTSTFTKYSLLIYFISLSRSGHERSELTRVVGFMRFVFAAFWAEWPAAEVPRSALILPDSAPRHQVGSGNTGLRYTRHVEPFS